MLGAVYMLWLYQRIIFGKLDNEENKDLKDLNLREQWTLIPLVIVLPSGSGSTPSRSSTAWRPTVDRVLERVAAAVPDSRRRGPGGRSPTSRRPRRRGSRR